MSYPSVTVTSAARHRFSDACRRSSGPSGRGRWKGNGVRKAGPACGSVSTRPATQADGAVAFPAATLERGVLEAVVDATLPSESGQQTRPRTRPFQLGTPPRGLRYRRRLSGDG